MAAQLFNALLQQASHDGARSTVLKPLAVLISILLSAILLSFYIKAPAWLGITLMVLMVSIFILFVGAYIYFMRVDPDALRSEKYSLQKMQIEKGIFGDDMTGVMDQADDRGTPRYSIGQKRYESGEQ